MQSVDQTQNAPADGTQSISIFDPPVVTGGIIIALVFMNLTGNLDNAIARLLLIPAVLALIIVPMFTSRALGRLLFCHLAGSRFIYFATGILSVERDGGPLPVKLNQHWGRYAGSTLSIPLRETSLRRWSVMRDLGSTLGLFAFIALVMVLTSLLGRLPGISDDPEQLRMATVVLFGVAVLTISIAVWALVNTQAPRAWRMMRGQPAGMREAALIGITSWSNAGIHPREWPGEWISMATAPSDGKVEEAFALRLAYMHALERGDTEMASTVHERLTGMVDELPKRARVTFQLEAPFHLAWVDRDAERARAMLDDLPDSFVARHHYRRVEAAVLLAEGEYEAAEAKAQEGLQTAVRRREDGESRWEADLLATIAQRAREGAQRQTGVTMS